MQFQLVTGLLPAHAALHVQSVNIDRDILDVFRRNPGSLVVMAKEANIHLIVFFLHDFGWPKPKTFHFSPNQLMIRYARVAEPVVGPCV